MSRRIIGQCNTADFKDLEHLAEWSRSGHHIDLHAVNSRRQNAALMVLRHFQLCGVGFDVVLKLREVLVWETENKNLIFEYKLMNPRDVATWRILWAMKPTQVSNN